MHVIQVGHNNLPTATTFTFCNTYIFKKRKMCVTKVFTSLDIYKLKVYTRLVFSIPIWHSKFINCLIYLTEFVTN